MTILGEIPPDGYILGHKFNAKKRFKTEEIIEELTKPKKIEDPNDFYNKYQSNIKLSNVRHNLKIKETELLDRTVRCEYVRGNRIVTKEWGIEKIEYTVCNNILPDGSVCGHPITASDSHRGESFCEKCGILTSTKKFVIPDNYDIGEFTEHYKNELSESGEHITQLIKSSKYNMIIENPPKITKKGKIYYGKSKKVWRESQKYFTLEILSSQLHMTDWQTEEVKDIMETYPLNKIHRRVNSNTIIAGICMYVLRLVNPKRGDLKYSNKIFSSYGLTKKNYSIMQKNLDRLLNDRM